MDFIEHRCGQSLGNIQRNQSPSLDGITDIDALGPQSLKNSCAVWFRGHQNGCFVSPENGGDRVREGLLKHRIIRTKPHLVTDRGFIKSCLTKTSSNDATHKIPIPANGFDRVQQVTTDA